MVRGKEKSIAGNSTVTYPFLILLIASFLEGGMVMIIELSGAKVIAPYYGTSLYVWAAVLGVTVGGLAAGYFLGGQLSKRSSFTKTIISLFAAGAVFTFLLPFIARGILGITTNWPLELAVIVGPLFYLLPPVICMGAVSPVLISAVHLTGMPPGRSTGTIYAVSTLGGILFTLLASFYLIPRLGISFSSVITGIVLALVALLMFAFAKRSDLTTANSKPSSVSSEKKMTAKTTLPINFLLLVSFLEGTALMVTELLGAKITAPYYGTSIFVWGGVLAVSLSALALGYYLGGLVSFRKKAEQYLFTLLLGSGFLVVIAPLIGPKILMSTDFLGIQIGALTSVLIYMFPPMVMMGMVSPIITELIREKFKAGQAAGTVYAISTIGGIIGTFVAGFLLIPNMGVKNLALLIGIGLSLVPFYYFIKQNKYGWVVGGLAAFILTIFLRPTPTISNTTRVLYQSTGILGEWTVLDVGDLTVKDNLKIQRKLLLNGIDQTFTQIGFEPLAIWSYPHKIGAYASLKPAGSKALLLGMGGGSIAYELLGMGMELDIVELDKRIPDIATRFFNYKPGSSNLVIDDARHYIRSTQEKYDVVVLDLVIGEVQPSHLFSVEGFEDLKKIIRDDALIILNFQGNIYDERYNVAPLSIYKTMESVGFNVSYYSIPNRPRADGKVNLTKDIFFVASLAEYDFKTALADLRYNDWFPFDDFEYDDLMKDEPLDLSGGQILVDDKPVLEILNAPNNLQWRKNKVQQNIKLMISEGIPIY